MGAAADAGMAPASRRFEPLVPKPSAELIVTNQTARRVVLKGRGGNELAWAPFERRELDEPQLEAFDLTRAAEYLEVEEKLRSSFNGLLIVFGLSVWAVPLYAVIGVAFGHGDYWKIGGGLIAAALVVALGIDLALAAKRKGRLGALTDTGAQLLMIAIVFVIGIGIPAAVLYYLADVDDVVRGIANAPPGTDLDREIFAVSARALQLVFVSMLTLLPALLFFLFDRQHLGTLRQDFIRQIIRFDRDVTSKRDVLAKYGPRMAEAYGSDGTTSRFVPARRSPLLLATLVIGLGWTLTLLRTGAETQPTTSSELIALFEPQRSAVTFGFLGAYFFALNAVFRGYIRKDLLPKTYTHITVRIMLTIILAWVLEVITQGGNAALALAFLAGIVPETAIRVVEDYVRRLFLRTRDGVPSLTDRHPLTNLDEIDIYDRGRMLDEGVNNVEALAHHDVIDLMLQTRIPVPRLVDWLDQAILYLHVGGYGGKGRDERRAALDALGRYGIRTATDLEEAVEAAKRRDGESGRGPEIEAVEKLLEGAPPRVRVILDVIEDEEWMGNLRDWRAFATRAPELVEVEAVPESPGA